MSSKPLLAVLAALFVSRCCAGDSLQLYEAVEPHMGTLFRIKVYAPDEKTAESAFHDAFARIKELDNTLSDYQPQSELSRITQLAVRNPVTVSDDLFRVLEAAQLMSEQTGGAFDITVGPLTHLWRKARHEHQLPSEQAITAARDRCGYRKLHLDKATRAVSFDQTGMLLDAGGIAKGYAADEALSILKKYGLHSALVAASGDLAFSDPPPGSEGWEIGIDSYDRAEKPFTRVLLLSNAAVSTSGSSEQSLQLGGKTYSHIINPKTGFGLTEDLTVTTVAPSGLLADPAATAISVLGCDKGLAFADNTPGLAAYILTKTLSGERLMHNHSKEYAQTSAH